MAFKWRKNDLLNVSTCSKKNIQLTVASGRKRHYWSLYYSCGRKRIEFSGNTKSLKTAKRSCISRIKLARKVMKLIGRNEVSYSVRDRSL